MKIKMDEAEIVSTLPFEWFKVREVMKLLDWKYWHTDEIPNVAMLRQTVEHLIKNVIESDQPMPLTSSSGGFEVTLSKSDSYSHELMIEVKFVAEHGYKYLDLD